jgi:threonine dehydrogenase-like Zn-dependent dehydrogenase
MKGGWKMPLPDTTRALWCTAPGKAELRAEAMPVPGPGQVLVQTLYSGISRGTESLVLRGLVPPSEFERMRAPFQAGQFPGPLKYGYSNVGRVVIGPQGLLGQCVFSLFPHQEHFAIDAQAAHPLPSAVPPRRAVLAANLETALNAIWDAAPLPGDRVTVVGAGVVGCLLLALLSRYPAIELEAVDVLDKRAPLVHALGAKFALPHSAQGERDIVFHASAQSAGLNRALELCRFEGKVIELSWYGTTPVSLALGGAFHSQRLQLICSQVGRVSPNKPGWSYTQRLELALQLLSDERLDALLGPDIEFNELPEYCEALVSGSASEAVAPGLCVRYA